MHTEELNPIDPLGRQMVAWNCSFKPDSGNPTVRDYRGALENTAMEEIGTHSTIERVDGGHSFPKSVSASSFYPDRQNKL